MKDNRLGALALILGAISGIITLTFHPAGGAHHVTPAQFEILIAVVIGVHALAIAGLPFSFLGTLALSRRIDSPNRIALVALVIYGFSLVAIMAAATMSGLVTPGVLRHMVAHDSGSDQWRMLMEYTHSINQGFARIGAVGSSLAIILWSVTVLTGRSLHYALGITASWLVSASSSHCSPADSILSCMVFASLPSRNRSGSSSPLFSCGELAQHRAQRLLLPNDIDRS